MDIIRVHFKISSTSDSSYWCDIEDKNGACGLRAAICQKRNIPDDRQMLTFGGSILTDDGPLSEHGIVNGSMVIVNDTQTIDVHLVQVGGKSAWLAVSPLLYIAELRCAVRHHLELPRMEYPFIEMALEDKRLSSKDRMESTLTDCGIVDQTVITIVISRAAAIADRSRSRSRSRA